MRIAIDQSNFLPWKGYFDLIRKVDIFVFYDCVQFTKKDWRTRNYIKTPDGIKLISIPVNGSTKLKINEVTISNDKWTDKIIKAFQMNYAKAPYFSEYKFIIEELFENKKWTKLSDFNQYSIKYISKLLKISTKFVDSRELDLKGSKTDRLIDAIKKLGGDYYLSGPKAKNYIENEKFVQNKIELGYIDYSNYPKYPQLWGDFNHYVTILDLIFNTGPDAHLYF